MVASNKSGTLSRANKLILRESHNISVFSLQHWSDHNGAPNFEPNPARQTHRIPRATRARLVRYKIQETVLNFLLRWLINQESARANQRVGFKTADSDRAPSDSNLWARQRRRTRSSLLLTNARSLPDRRLSTVLRFLFWRWLTCTNLFELLLIIVLISCCIYQCYEILGDYYQYPTHVSMSKIMNGDFYQDLPGLTFCNNNRVSKETIAEKFPHLNDTHFVAITQGTFYSVDNFTVDMGRTLDYVNVPEQDDAYSRRMEMTELERYIDWKIVGPYLAKGTIKGMFDVLPGYDIVDSVTCANIWGEQLPCQKLRRIEAMQQKSICRTLFHRWALTYADNPGVQELQVALENQPKQVGIGEYGSVTSGSLLLDTEEESWFGGRPSQKGLEGAATNETVCKKKQILSELMSKVAADQQDETKVRVEMGHLEVLRIRINFRPNDYKNKRLFISGKLSIHSNSALGSMSHIVYNIRPGLWYNYYVQRFDYRRLPPPYTTKCFEYQDKSQVKVPLAASEKKELYELIEEQARKPAKLIERYGRLLRHRSLGGRGCYNICKAELSSAKCKCWPKWMPFERTYQGKITRLCDNDYLLQNFAANGSGPTGDDLHFQLCLKDFYSICSEACPDECRFSSFDIAQQSRSWPSEESQRYLKDNSVLVRLQEEAECCATISVTYSSLASSLHLTEPKYTRQDVVTIISGNIEAWIGVSAVHGYLFLEQLYEALLEAQLIRPPGGALLRSLRGPRWFVNFSSRLISILTHLVARVIGALRELLNFWPNC